MYGTQVSNEVIDVNVDRDFGKEIEKIVSIMREEYKAKGVIPDSCFKILNDFIHAATGLYLTFKPAHVANMYLCSLWFLGQGMHYAKKDSDRVWAKTKDGLKYTCKIDLKNMRVSGTLVEEFKVEGIIGTLLFEERMGLSDAELTAVILHEIGHAFNWIVTAGEYVYLDYMLSDGIDVLLGNKRNVHHIELLDHTWVEKNIPREERESFLNHRTPDNMRRLILTLWKKAPRSYLFDNGTGAIKRDEQMADMFAARLGYGRALATATHRLFNVKSNSDSSVVAALKSVLILGTLPLSVYWALACQQDENIRSDINRYDSGYERLNRIRKELITQLKTISDSTLKPMITSDIDAIDELLKEYDKSRGTFDKFAMLVNPLYRKRQQNLQVEQDLSDLMNNPIFVDAFKMSRS